MNTTVALTQSEQVGTIKTVVVGEKIAFKCGDSSITLEQDGTIKIKGVNIDIDGCGVVTIRGNPLHLNPDPPKKDNEEQCLKQAAQEGTPMIDVSES